MPNAHNQALPVLPPMVAAETRTPSCLPLSWIPASASRLPSVSQLMDISRNELIPSMLLYSPPVLLPNFNLPSPFGAINPSSARTATDHCLPAPPTNALSIAHLINDGSHLAVQDRCKEETVPSVLSSPVAGIVHASNLVGTCSPVRGRGNLLLPKARRPAPLYSRLISVISSQNRRQPDGPWDASSEKEQLSKALWGEVGAKRPRPGGNVRQRIYAESACQQCRSIHQACDNETPCSKCIAHGVSSPVFEVAPTIVKRVFSF